MDERNEFSKLQLKRWSRSVDDCNLALAIDDSYIKAYLRRGKSLMELERYDEAVRDFEKIQHVFIFSFDLAIYPPTVDTH